MSGERFYIHEDDWGRVSFEPEENRFDRTRVASEVRAFGDAHRAPNGIGWTDVMVVPPPPIDITVRAISLATLRAALGPTAFACTEVTTGYSTHVEHVASGFAFRCSTEPYWDVVYGCAANGMVTQLHLTFGTPAIADLLHRLGTAHRMILCDLSRDGVVELANRTAIDRYLADDVE
ncbi:MAG: hypothetical protein ABI175_03280, partial [Polyangiales bacterium]